MVSAAPIMTRLFPRVRCRIQPRSVGVVASLSVDRRSTVVPASVRRRFRPLLLGARGG